MKIIRQKKDLDKIINSNHSLSFVPTMGSLHKGHLSLIKEAKKKRLKILVSIFVNPRQFSSRSDFNTYPRNIKNDLKLLKKIKIDFLFLPKYNDVFNFKTRNKIYIHPFAKILCGKFRTGHFKGVLNVVNRFLELIKPKYLFLGEKDFQQLILIQKHILEKKIKTTVVNCRTIRQDKFLPYSSRNFNLKKSEKQLATEAFKQIKNYKNYLIKKNIKKIDLGFLKKKIFSLGVKKIDYIDVVNLDNLKKTKNFKGKIRIFSAFYVNRTRLIDNV